MKAQIRIGVMSVMTAGVLVGQITWAQGPGGGVGMGTDDERPRMENRKGGERSRRERGPGGEARDQHRQEMRERMQKHHEARKALMDALKAEEDVGKALAMVREHCLAQHEERTKFHEAKMAEHLEHVGERLKEKGVDSAKSEEILKEMVQNMEERKAEAQASFDALLASLDALKGKADLTKGDILKALRENAPERRHQRRSPKDRKGGSEGRRNGPPRGDDEGEGMKTGPRDGSGPNQCAI